MENQNKMTGNKTIDSKYIQQHLANERTFLAWVRTAIAMIGIGFLITNLHFSGTIYSEFSDMIAYAVGLLAAFFGIITIILATINYLRKLEEINNQTYRASKALIILLSVITIIIMTVFSFYFFI
ncbi:YidH family protein [Litchfieldia alkalitelluris]|uniref:YidH family protein n=1 Tax=Litchfieldia alkalitelluris TaxID=304268 RepID=UPI0009975BBD|nr:DUF202 domain-containing protein [Litchfieldia alkalitelluris]